MYVIYVIAYKVEKHVFEVSTSNWTISYTVCRISLLKKQLRNTIMKFLLEYGLFHTLPVCKRLEFCIQLKNAVKKVLFQY